MRFSKVISALVVGLALSSGAYAAGVSMSAQGSSVQQNAFMTGGPEPVPAGFSAEIAERLFNEGSIINGGHSLRGEWKLVGGATALNVRGIYVGTEGYDPNGIRNPDGSLLFYLSFNSTNSDFDRSFAVTSYNMGNKDTSQGPYVVSFGDARFSTYAYNGANLSQSYFEWQCRLTGSSQSMVCRTVFHAVNDNSNTARLDGLVVQYFGYVKTTP